MAKKQLHRGTETYLTNPFVTPLLVGGKVSKKRILSNQRGSMMVVNREDQSEVAPISGFWAAEIVDDTKFIKLYKNGVRAFSGLTPAGFKVFGVLYDEVQNNIGKAEVLLSYKRIDQETNPMSESTFRRGLQELVRKNFIAREPIDNVFWVNPDYIFNGNRLAFCTEYLLENSSEAKEYILKRKKLETDQNQTMLPLEDPSENVS